jgi:hypothetical protein
VRNADEQVLTLRDLKFARKWFLASINLLIVSIICSR